MSSVVGDQQKIDDDPMKQTMLIIEHKIRNLEKRKLKLDGYIQHLHGGVKLSEDQLLAASKLSEVTSTLDFARNLKKQLSSLLTKKQTKNHNPVEEKLNTKIKEVLIFQNILENIKNESVKKDLLNGHNGAIQLTADDLSKLSHFSKMVSPKRIVEEGKPLFEDQLKAVSKHYMKLVENRPNIVIGTSYAHLKECLLKIEKSGYLNSITITKNKEVNTNEEVNTLDTIPQSIQQVDSTIEPLKELDNVSISSVNNVEYSSNKIETVYFTNNNVSGNTIDKEPYQNKNVINTVFNSSFEFLQDSQLDEDIYSVNPNSIPTQTFSSSYYKDESIDKEIKPNHLKNITNASNSWTEKTEVNWQNKTESCINTLPKENWAQAVIDSTSNDWLVKNNWVHVAEADNSEQKTLTNTSQTSPNFGLVTVTNGYPENLELLKNSVIFNKQDPYPVATSNNSTFYQNNYRQQSQENNICNYTNTNTTYYEKNQSTDFNKRCTAVKSNTSYAGDYWRH